MSRRRGHVLAARRTERSGLEEADTVHGGESKDGFQPSRALLRLLLWGPFAALVLRYFAHTTDDAFIPMRYAWNLLHGDGLVFNPGERVEGFTSPLHLLVTVAVVALPVGPTLLVAKLVSTAFAAAALWLTGRLIAAAKFPGWATVLATLLAGGSWMLAFNAANALETSLLTFVVTGLVVLMVRGGPDRWVLIGLVAAAAVLTRPDAALLVAALAVTSMWIERARPWWHRVRWAAVAGGVIGLVTALRFAYFGSVLPNTFHAKRVPPAQVVGEGLDYLVGSLQPGAILSDPGSGSVMAMVALVVLAVLFVAGAVGWVARNDRLAYCVSPVLAQAVAVVAVGGDWMLGGRFVAPVALLLAVTQARGAVEIASVLERKQSCPAVAVRTAVVGLALLVTLPGLADTAAHPLWRTGWRLDDESLIASGGYGRDWARATEMLTCARPGDLVLFSEMGYGPWQRTDLRFIDARGLTDREIATRTPRRLRHTWGIEDPDWNDRDSVTVQVVLRREPELVVTYSENPPRSFANGRYITEGVESPVEGYTVYRRADVRCDD